MYSRFLFIGLGGSGGKTLRFIKRELLSVMEEHGIENPRIPKAWQFLNFDTPTNPDGGELDSFVKPLDVNEYQGLITRGTTLVDLQRGLDQRTQLHSELQGWRVHPQGVSIGLSKGAGQFRAVGRSVAMSSATKITKVIRERLQTLKDSDQAELDEIEEAITGKSPKGGKQPATHIMIISSLAGGSGAGMLLEVCDIIRGMDRGMGDEIFGVLYTPEVFETLGAGSTGGVQPNALAAISEVLNGYWHGGDNEPDSSSSVPHIEDRVLESVGLANTIVNSGPAYPFLIGRVNQQGIDHNNPVRLFEIVAKSISSMMTSPTVYDKFVAYVIGNWHQYKTDRQAASTNDILVNAGLTEEQGYPVFSSLGYARLSIGIQYFKRYAVERILKATYDHLTQYHYRSKEALDIQKDLDENNPDIVAQEIAKQHEFRFKDLAGLNEITDEFNQVQDAITPEGINSDVSARQAAEKFQSNVIRAVQDRIGNSKKIEGTEARKICEEEIDFYLRSFSEECDKLVAQEVKAWIDDIGTSILNATEYTISRIGLKATSEVCRLVSNELEGALQAELQRESDGAENRVNNFHAHLEQIAEQGKINKGNKILDKCLSAAIKNAAAILDKKLAEQSQVLCSEVSKRYLVPMQKALKEALELAINESQKMDEYADWNNNPPPTSVTPQSGEYTLIKSKDFPKIFNRLLTETTNIPSNNNESLLKNVIEPVILSNYLHRSADFKSIEDMDEFEGPLKGRDNKKPDLHTIRETNNGWYPKRPNDLKAAQNVTLELLLNIEDTEKRIVNWLRRDGSPFGNYLGTGLSSYLGNSDTFTDGDLSESEIKSRRNRFISQFGQATNSAAPLANIGSAFVAAHPGDDESEMFKYSFSEMPFASHDLKEQMSGILLSRDLTQSDIDDVFNNDESITHIDITTFIEKPVSPLVFDSIFRPIADRRQEAKSKGIGALQDFWKNRRAKPLARFVPAPQTVIVAMIRGWFTCRILGLVTQPNFTKDKPAEIVHWQTGKAIKFPHPLLNPKPIAIDTMSAILESLSLAYTEVNLTGHLDALDPYISLRNFGMSSGDRTVDDSIWSYGPDIHPRLREWILDGELPDAIEKQHRDFNVDSQTEVTPEVRIELIKNYLTNRENEFLANKKEYFTKAKHSPKDLSRPPYWVGLHDLIQRAIADLSDEVHNFSQTLGEADW